MSYYTVDDECVEYASEVANIVCDEDNVPEDGFDEYLDELYDSVVLFDITFMPSQILKECDPIAYRTYFNDWADGMLTEMREDIERDIERHHSLYDGDSVFINGYEVIYHEDDEEGEEDTEEDGEDED